MDGKIITDITPRSILRFTLPSIIMMLFMSLYTLVDSVFIARFVDEMALSAVNIAYPAMSVVIAVAVMLGSGGSAEIANCLGRGQKELARQRFTALVVCGVVFGFVLAFIGLFFTEEISLALGATPLLYDYCVDYLRPILIASPMAVLQMMFQSLFVTAGRPNLGLAATVAGGVANVILDYVFIVIMGLGVMGAALGTAIGYCIPALFGLVWFFYDKKGELHFVKPMFEARILARACFNGSSEMVTNLAAAVTTFLFNLVALRFLAEAGVAAVTIVLYAQFLIIAVFIGYSIGIAPVISYHYGRGNRSALSKCVRISLKFIAVGSVVGYVISILAKGLIISVYAPETSEVYAIAYSGWNIFALSYIVMGFNIFASAMFTALMDGLTSALISFLRTFIFLSAFILGLPYVLGIDGIWLAVPVAEVVTLVFSIRWIVKKRELYGY